MLSSRSRAFLYALSSRPSLILSWNLSKWVWMPMVPPLPRLTVVVALGSNSLLWVAASRGDAAWLPMMFQCLAMVHCLISLRTPTAPEAKPIAGDDGV